MLEARPRPLLMPLQIGVSVQLFHHYTSRFLIDSLYKHGFAVDTMKFNNLNEMLC